MSKRIACCLVCIVVILPILANCRKNRAAAETTAYSIQTESSPSYVTPSPSSTVSQTSKPLPSVKPFATPLPTATPSPSVTPSPSISITTKTESGETKETENHEPKTKSLLDMGWIVYAEEIGLHGFGHSFYWSPDMNGILFEGFEKSNEGKYTSGLYYYNIKNHEIINIIKGKESSIYYMEEPNWSITGNEILFSYIELSEKNPLVYLYNFQTGKLDTLPVAGRQATFSSDCSKIIFTSADEKLHIYQLSDATIQTLPEEIKGRSPLWFSDDRHILFLKDAGINPSGLEGADLYEICILDMQNTERFKIIGDRQVYHKLNWMLQDSTAWVESGWDDGHSVSILDINERKVQELGEAGYIKYITGRAPDIIFKKDENVWEIFGYNYEYSSCPAESIPLCQMPDSSLMFWQSNLDEKHGRLYKVTSRNSSSILTHDNNILYPYVSHGGSKLVFVADAEESFFLITDIITLFSMTREEKEPVPSSEEIFVEKLIQAFNDEDIDFLSEHFVNFFSTPSPEKIKQALKLFREHFNGEKLVDFVYVDRIYLQYNNPDTVGNIYLFISESGISRKMEILRTGKNNDYTYSYCDLILYAGTMLDEHVRGWWFEALKSNSVEELYDYFRIDDGDYIPPYKEEIHPNLLKYTNSVLTRYNNAFQMETINIDFTGYSSSGDDTLYLEYEISGLSPDGIPAKHRIYGVYEPPVFGINDKWMR